MLLIGGEAAGSVSAGRTVRIEGLPDFGQTGVARVEKLDGWDSAAAVSPILVPNGGAAGAVAADGWRPAETYLLFSGIFVCDYSAHAALRQALLSALPYDRDVSLQVLGGSWDIDKQMWVRRYDKADITREANYLRFSVPLVAVDPFKYALDPASGQMGTYSGQAWFRTYTDPGGSWARTYASSSRFYEQLVDETALPDSLTLVSDGDAPSSRVTATIVGPLEAGDWWLQNEATGERLEGLFALTAAQTLTLDSSTRSATLGGADVSYGMLGDWPTLQPGQNTYRLAAGSPSSASATVEAFPAFE